MTTTEAINKILAFIMGVKECKSDVTTSFTEPLINYYDLGRNLGEKLHRKEFY
jgi:hypothetical protein